MDFDEEGEPEAPTPIGEGAPGPTLIAPVDTTTQRNERRDVERSEERENVEEARDPFGHSEERLESPAPSGFAEGVSPTILPSSTSRVNDTYYTAPEHRVQRDKYRALASDSRILEESHEDTPDVEEPSQTHSGDRNPSIFVVPSRDRHEESPALSTVDRVPVSGEINSETSLLRHSREEEDEEVAAAAAENYGPKRSNVSLQHAEPHVHDKDTPVRMERVAPEGSRRVDRRLLSHVNSVRLSVEDKLLDRQRRAESRRSQHQEGVVRREQHRSASAEGEIVRAERMLVRMDVTQQDVPDEYAENASLKIDSRIAEKWREYLVVCRKGHDEQTPFLLQLYKTRVIPQVQTPRVKRHFSHEIQLRRSTTKVNLFSCLDKTMVIWHPYREWTRIFIMRTRSAAHSVEWYTFIREALGWHRPSTLMVHVPDLDMSLRLKNPFAHLEAKQNFDQNRCAVILETMAREQAIASGIINTCLDTLQKCQQLSTMLDMWTKYEKIGLAWRRYDRLEWVQGANEKRMYGAHAMREYYELELRPKQHYPTYTHSAGSRQDEPPPIEGFLILLTSQKGKHKRFGKAFHRRLYFYTQDQYLCFCKPSKACPPAPPRLPTIAGTQVPTSNEIRRESPLVHDVDPYPVDDNGRIVWLMSGRKTYTRRHDEEAYAENRRNVMNMAHAEGYFNLCRVVEVRPVTSGEPDDACVNSGDVDFHGHTRSNEGSPLDTGRQTKGNRTLELVLDDGLVVKLRTYNMQTRQEWIERLQGLSAYWKARTHDDIRRLKGVRQRNLDIMGIDEEQESLLGQVAQKWEVGRAEASPELFHTCGISGCRAVKVCSLSYTYHTPADKYRCRAISTAKPAAVPPLSTAPSCSSKANCSFSRAACEPGPARKPRTPISRARPSSTCVIATCTAGSSRATICCTMAMGRISCGV